MGLRLRELIIKWARLTFGIIVIQALLIMFEFYPDMSYMTGFAGACYVSLIYCLVDLIVGPLYDKFVVGDSSTDSKAAVNDNGQE